jgi:fido (protein-threonine AMPylation protein)
LLPAPQPYTRDNLLKLHEILLRGIDDSIAGRFRDRRVMIRGAKHQSPSDSEVYDLTSEFLDQLASAEAVDPVALASWAHWCITRIHPFVDGNGRISRLWQDLILFRHRLTCAIIPPESKREYIEDLGEADDGNFNPLIQLVCRRIGATFDRYIAAQQRVDERSQWARELVGEATARATEKRRLEYERWRRKMEELRYEFERSASTITHMSPDIQIQFKMFDIVDQATWENLRSGPGASKTWFFQLIFRRNRRSWSYLFFFAKHFWSEADTEEDRSEPRVCLLISEQIGGQDSIRLDRFPDSPVTLKEVFVVNKSFNRKQTAIDRDGETLQHDVSASLIAQDFIKEVILHRLT